MGFKQLFRSKALGCHRTGFQDACAPRPPTAHTPSPPCCILPYIRLPQACTLPNLPPPLEPPPAAPPLNTTCLPLRHFYFAHSSPAHIPPLTRLPCTHTLPNLLTSTAQTSHTHPLSSTLSALLFCALFSCQLYGL